MKRFVDDGITLNRFSRQPILVECPFCLKNATVYTKKIDDVDFEQPFFSCQNCCKSFDQKAKQENNLGYFSGVYLDIEETCRCKRGKFQFHQYYAKRSFVPQFIELNCNFCPISKRIYPNQFDIRKQFNRGFNTDPYFGYCLASFVEIV